MPNIKAGDLAIVKSNKPQYNGRIVEVIYAAPAVSFYLPNGQWHRAPGQTPAWVIKAVGAPILAPMDGGNMVPVWYGVGEDRFLFPLPGETESHEEALPATVTPDV